MLFRPNLFLLIFMGFALTSPSTFASPPGAVSSSATNIASHQLNQTQLNTNAIGAFSNIITSAALGAGSGGGGAGCPQSDGSVITLLECGEPEPTSASTQSTPAALAIDAPSEIPEGLNELINYIKNYPYFTDNQRQFLLNAIQPTFYRKYFYVDQAPDLTQNITDTIKGQFQNVTGLDPGQLILYGVTDPNASMSNSDHPAQITYLLPAFRKLKTLEEKMTALYHESYWVLNREAKYPDVVTSEIAFEGAFQKPQDTQKQIDFLNTVIRSDNSLLSKADHWIDSYANIPLGAYPLTSPALMKLLLKRDLETGALNGFLDAQNQVTNIQLFGADTIACFSEFYKTAYVKDSNVEYQPNFSLEEMCNTKFGNHRDSLLRNYPKSLLLAATKGIVTSGYDGMDTILTMINYLAGEFDLPADDPKADEYDIQYRDSYEVDCKAAPILFNTKVLQWKTTVTSRNSLGLGKCSRKSLTYEGPSTESVIFTLTTDPKSETIFGNSSP